MIQVYTFCIQQSWQSKLLLCNIKCIIEIVDVLGWTKAAVVNQIRSDGRGEEGDMKNTQQSDFIWGIVCTCIKILEVQAHISVGYAILNHITVKRGDNYNVTGVYYIIL